MESHACFQEGDFTTKARCLSRGIGQVDWASIFEGRRRASYCGACLGQARACATRDNDDDSIMRNAIQIGQLVKSLNHIPNFLRGVWQRYSKPPTKMIRLVIIVSSMELVFLKPVNDDTTNDQVKDILNNFFRSVVHGTRTAVKLIKWKNSDKNLPTAAVASWWLSALLAPQPCLISGASRRLCYVSSCTTIHTNRANGFAIKIKRLIIYGAHGWRVQSSCCRSRWKTDFPALIGEALLWLVFEKHSGSNRCSYLIVDNQEVQPVTTNSNIKNSRGNLIHLSIDGVLRFVARFNEWCKRMSLHKSHHL